jgi:hypothetical protein
MARNMKLGFIPMNGVRTPDGCTAKSSRASGGRIPVAAGAASNDTEPSKRRI